MQRYLAIPIVTSILSGCAVQPLTLKDRATQSYQVSIKTLIVDNLATEAKIGSSEVVYVNGWVPAHAGFKPPLHEAFVAKSKNSLIASGASGRVDVSVLRVGYFVEKSVSDDVALVNLLAVGKERGFKCDADVNVKTESDSRRMTLTHEIRRPYFDSTEQALQFIDSCQSDLIRQLAAVLNKPV